MKGTDKEITKKKFGAAAEKIRKQKKLTLRDVEAACTLENSKIAKIEDGQINITLTTLVDLAKGLGVPAAHLVGAAFGK